MSQNVSTPHQLTRKERTNHLIEGILQGKTICSIAEEIGVNRRTCIRDFEKWLQTSEQTKLHEEWFILYSKVKQDNPEKALECLTRLIAKTMVQKVEAKTEVTENKTVTYNINNYSEEEKHAILAVYGRIRDKQGSSQTQPENLH